MAVATSVNAATGTMVGASSPVNGKCSFQISTSGTVDLTYELELSMDDVDYLSIISQATTVAETVGYESNAYWKYARASITTYVSGTITIQLGAEGKFFEL